MREAKLAGYGKLERCWWRQLLVIRKGCSVSRRPGARPQISDLSSQRLHSEVREQTGSVAESEKRCANAFGGGGGAWNSAGLVDVNRAHKL